MAVWAAGCAATTAVNTLPQAGRDALRIDAIDLSFAPNAGISWLDALPEFTQSGAADTPEARRAFLQRKAFPHIKAALDTEVLPAFRGTTPARLKVVIRAVNVQSAVLRLLVGGNYRIKGDIAVVDAKTGKTIVEGPDFNGDVSGGPGPAQVLVEQALPDPIDRVSRQFAFAIVDWLKTGRAFATGGGMTKNITPPQLPGSN